MMRIVRLRPALVVAAALGLALSGAAIAQEAPPPPEELTSDGLSAFVEGGEGESDVMPENSAPATEALPEVTPQGPDAAAGRFAMLRGLDRLTGLTEDLPVQVGQTVDFGRLAVRLDECRFPAQNPNSDAYALLSIADKEKGTPSFQGWMIASSPALSALDDPRYDVWVISCKTS
ncbi:DUF2155 domain-containing protein [Paracoccus pacificus]|uniref:DUF2155 domain-containing protein n=1 Tax=Paracoccus pacificus TaxID=1463598 RepID=A0ABW4RCK2_9RHOB